MAEMCKQWDFKIKGRTDRSQRRPRSKKGVISGARARDTLLSTVEVSPNIEVHATQERVSKATYCFWTSRKFSSCALRVYDWMTVDVSPKLRPRIWHG
jgi:hypothetical protein